MDLTVLRHFMASIIVAEELRVPNMRQADKYLSDDKMRKQFTGLLENTYCIVDLMIEIGDRRFLETMAEQQAAQADAANEAYAQAQAAAQAQAQALAEAQAQAYAEAQAQIQSQIQAQKEAEAEARAKAIAEAEAKKRADALALAAEPPPLAVPSFAKPKEEKPDESKPDESKPDEHIEEPPDRLI